MADIAELLVEEEKEVAFLLRVVNVHQHIQTLFLQVARNQQEKAGAVKRLSEMSRDYYEQGFNEGERICLEAASRLYDVKIEGEPTA